jgi:S-adenosylmethionine:tRNA ribosyltransferase-isomerase
MDVRLFDFPLPVELIAQQPPRRRSDSRLLVLDRKSGERRHARFPAILEYLNPGDGLVVNNTKVFKARLSGQRKTGGKIEVFLVRPESGVSLGDPWQALVSPSRRLREGEEIIFDRDHSVKLATHIDDGRWIVDFGSASERNTIISRFGHVPLPPYISRTDGALDQRRYQTIFADPSRSLAVAAPTAGLHFTKSLLSEIKKRGVTVIELTLHVGPGTFKPIKTERIEDHRVDPEFAELSAIAADDLNRVRKNGGKIIAVGTTSVRTLEAAPITGGVIAPFAGLVDLFIRPGFEFKVVDRLVTNFHLPQSSLLVLVAAFAGRERVLEAYREAVEQKYRFYSYGDAMLIL